MALNAMIQRSTNYKLVQHNRVIDQGSKDEMRKLQKKTPGSFVGLGVLHKIGDQWNRTPVTTQPSQ